MFSAAWAGFKAFGLLTKVGIIAGLLIAVLGVVWIIVNSIEEGGANKVKLETATETITQVEKAHATKQEAAKRTESQRDADCVRDARNPEDC